MALWQIVFDPDLIRHDPHFCMIFKWMLWREYEAGASLMEGLEAVNHALLSGISSNLMAVTYGGKIRRCGRNLWNSILSQPLRSEIGMNGKETWPPILLQPIPTFQFTSIKSLSTAGIISRNMPLYKTLSLSSTKTESQDMGNGSKHFSQLPTLEEQIRGSSFRPHRGIPGWITVPYL